MWNNSFGWRFAASAQHTDFSDSTQSVRMSSISRVRAESWRSNSTVHNTR
jgi:hypothetical protein